jgi:hypothetical protein
MNMKLIRGFLATAALGLVVSQATAGSYTNNKIWDLQTAKLADNTHRIVFKACSGSTCYWWTPANTSTAADSVRTLASTAFLTGKRVNIQCGGTANSGCACQNAAVFENGNLVTRCVWGTDGMQIIE